MQRVSRTIFLILTMATLLATMTSCAPLRLVANYDALIDSGATQVQKKIDTFLLAQERTTGTPEASYAKAVPFYDSLGVDLELLQERAALQSKNEETIKQIGELKKNLVILQGMHQRHPDGIPKAEIPTLRAAFDVPCQAIIKFELAKKRDLSSPKTGEK